MLLILLALEMVAKEKRLYEMVKQSQALEWRMYNIRKKKKKKPEFLRSVEQQQYDAVKVREMKADKHRNNKRLPTLSVKREIFLDSS